MVRRFQGGGRSSTWLELQFVELVVAGSNPVAHPIPALSEWPSVILTLCQLFPLTTPEVIG